MQGIIENRRRNHSRRTTGKEPDAPPKKRGRPPNPDSQRNRLKVLRAEYKRARLEYQDGDEDEDDRSFMDPIP
jgi:hypothetical protein